jgi:hypothetical protein
MQNFQAAVTAGLLSCLRSSRIGRTGAKKAQLFTVADQTDNTTVPPSDADCGTIRTQKSDSGLVGRGTLLALPGSAFADAQNDEHVERSCAVAAWSSSTASSSHKTAVQGFRDGQHIPRPVVLAHRQPPRRPSS